MRLISLLAFLAAGTAAAQSPSDIDQAMSPFAEDFAGVVRIERGGEPVFEKAYGFANWELDVPNTPATKFKIHSITKTLTAAAIHRAADQERIDLEAGICGYLSACPESWASVKVRHLLNHSSGIPDHLNAYAGQWNGGVTSTLDAVLADSELPDAEFPGTEHAYSNFGYMMLAAILERIYGQTYEEVLQTQIFTRANMDATGVEPAPPNGARGAPPAIKGVATGYNGSAEVPRETYSMTYIMQGAGGIYATAEDLGDFAEALFEQRLTTAKMLDAMVTPDPGLGTAYAYGVVTRDRNGLLSHNHTGGTNGYLSLLGYYPDYDATIIVLSNQGFSPLEAIKSALENVLLEAAS